MSHSLQLTKVLKKAILWEGCGKISQSQGNSKTGPEAHSDQTLVQIMNFDFSINSVHASSLCFFNGHV